MFRQEVNVDFWIDKEYSLYRSDKEKFPNLIGIVTDVRYENEASFFIRNKYPLIRIYRPNYFLIDSHPSEIELDNFKFPYYLENSASLETLEDQWKNLINILV
jgi:hypothetical protein